MNSPSSDQHAIVWERRQAELWERLFQVTQDVVSLAEGLAAGSGGEVLKTEMIRSAFSVGVEVVRATAADERHALHQHLGEARLRAIETDYWLRLAYTIQQREDVQHDLSSIITQYAAIVEMLQRLMKHIQEEKDAVSRHSRGPKVSL